MKLHKKSEWFILDKPIAEPNEKYYDSEYFIERLTYSDGTIVWFGINVNWKSENGRWFELSINEDAKPIEKYLPEIVYGSDRTYWKELDELPIYEKLYLNINSNGKNN